MGKKNCDKWKDLNLVNVESYVGLKLKVENKL